MNQFFKNKTRFLLVLLVFIGALLALKHIIFKPKVLPKSPKLVEVTQATQSSIQQTIRLLGTIRPLHATVLIAKNIGTFDALIGEGEKVHKGDLIAKIANADIENNLKLSEVAENLAKLQYERLAGLNKTGYVSAREVEEKKQAWIAAQKELSKAKIELDSLRFYAPFDGIVGVYKKREGTQVRLNDPVVTIYDPNSLIVDVDIPCANNTSFKKGQIVYVLNKKYTLTHLQNMIDDESHMCPADIAIRCEHCLIGSSVDVDIVMKEKKSTVIVPYTALFLRDGKTFVYAINHSKLILNPVKIGLRDKNRLEITSGLKAGQILVTKGQERLYPNMEVTFNEPKFMNTPLTVTAQR